MRLPSLKTVLGGMRGQAVAAVGLKAFGVSAAMLLQWLVARQFGATGQGLFALMATTISLVGVVAIFGQDYLALRNISGDLAEDRPDHALAHARASIRITAVGSAIATAAIAVTALVYDRLLDSSLTAMLLLAALPACAALAIGRLYSFIARADGTLFTSQLIDGPITSGLGAVLVAGLWLWPQPPLWLLGVAYSIANLGALWVGLSIGRRAMRKWPLSEQIKSVRPLVISGISRVLGYASPFLSDWLIIFTVTAVWGSFAAGLVRVPTLFIVSMALIANAIDAVFAPRIAAAVRLRHDGELRRLYRNHVAASLVLNLPIVAILVVFPDIVLGLFGPEFVVSASDMRIGVLIQTLTVALGPAGLVLVMSHNEKLTYFSNLFGIVVLAIGCTIAIPRFGVTGGIYTFVAVMLGKRTMEFALVRFKLGSRLLV